MKISIHLCFPEEWLTRPVVACDIFKVCIAVAELILRFANESLDRFEGLLCARHLSDIVRAQVGVDLVFQLLGSVSQLDTGFAGNENAVCNLVLFRSSLVSACLFPV